MEATLNHYCGICHNLHPASPIAKQDKLVADLQDVLLIEYTMEELRTSSDSGCRFCSLLFQVIRHFSPRSLTMSRSLTIRLAPKATPQLILSIEILAIEIHAPQGKLNK
jgi:hypothetical protein